MQAHVCDPTFGDPCGTHCVHVGSQTAFVWHTHNWHVYTRIPVPCHLHRLALHVFWIFGGRTQDKRDLYFYRFLDLLYYCYHSQYILVGLYLKKSKIYI